MEFKRILFATDFSETSQKALEAARRLRDQMSAELEVLHVFDKEAFDTPLPYGMMPGAATWSQEHVTKIREHAQKHLDDVRVQLGDVDGHFVEGNAGEEIVHYAEARDVDLIVMGTHGFKGMRRVLMGSVAEYVLRHTDRALLTIKGA